MLICGGAGFLGSHVARRFVAAGDRHRRRRDRPRDWRIARPPDHIRHAIDLRTAPIEAVDDLRALVGSADVIVDAMAWTRHLAALQDPLQDMRLNLAPHLALVGALRGQGPRLVVYLGSRSQYGRMAARVVTEDEPMTPRIRRACIKWPPRVISEHYAALDGYHVVSLRFPNCFGEGQPVSGEDIGLIGGFIRTLCQGGTVKVYGEGRRRAILYARDAAGIVARIASRTVRGVHAAERRGLRRRHPERGRAAAGARRRRRGGRRRDAPEIAAIDHGSATLDEKPAAGHWSRIHRSRISRARCGGRLDYFRVRLA